MLFARRDDLPRQAAVSHGWKDKVFTSTRGKSCAGREPVLVGTDHSGVEAAENEAGGLAAGV